MKHWVIFGTVYTIVYVVLAIAAINPEGTGTGVFLVPMITWIFLLAALYLSNRLDDVRNRIFFCLAMLTHYIVSLLFISVLFTESHDTSGGFWRMWERQWGLLLLTAGWYVLGQGFTWSRFYESSLERNRKFCDRPGLPRQKTQQP